MFISRFSLGYGGKAADQAQNKKKTIETETSDRRRRSNKGAGWAASEPPGEILSEAKDLTHQNFRSTLWQFVGTSSQSRRRKQSSRQMSWRASTAIRKCCRCIYWLGCCRTVKELLRPSWPS